MLSLQHGGARWESVRPHVPDALGWLAARVYNITDPGPGSEV